MKKSLFSEKLNQIKAELAPKDGRDGYIPVKGVDYFDGQDGYTPIKGVDYFTEQEVQEIKKEVTEDVLSQIPVPEDGKDGVSPDPEEVVKIVLEKIPTFNANKLKKEILAEIPNRSELKIIQEKLEVDPMSVIDKIMEIAPDKLRLKTSNIDGLEQTISAFHSQLGRGYLHGGGISNITGLITAGTNITITGTGTSSDPYIINGSASGVTSINTLTGAVTLAAGTNISLGAVGNTITINATGGGSPAGTTHDIQFNTGGAFDADTGKFVYYKDTNDLHNMADYGSEQAPALTTGNWTLGTGWAFGTSPNRLLKNAAGTGSATPSAATWVQANKRYKIVIDATVTSDYFAVSIGGNPYIPVGNLFQYKIDATGIWTFYLYTIDTTKLQFTTNNSTSRFEINSLSVVEVLDGYGDGLFEGSMEVNTLKNNGVLIAQAFQTYLPASANDYVIPKIPSVNIIQGSNNTITGINQGQVDGQVFTITNLSPSTLLTLPHQSTSSAAANRFQTPTSDDVVLGYGEEAQLKYRGGSINRWFVVKTNTAAPQYNGLTLGQTFGDFLGTLIANSDNMLIGTGQTTFATDNTTNKTTAIGDTQNNGYLTQVIVDDDDQLVYARANKEWYFFDGGQNTKLLQMKTGEGDFTLRVFNISSRTLIFDSLSSAPADIDNSALLELRTNTDGNSSFRGFLPPRMTGSQAESISSPGEGLMVYSTDGSGTTITSKGWWGWDNSTWVQLG